MNLKADDPSAASSERAALKHKVGHAVKWGLIDKVSVQIIYALTGIILAIKLSRADFGLVGAVMVFQAFGTLFVDSGFASALIQRKHPSQADYSTVFWFNLFVACLVYAILFIAAPAIAGWYDGDMRIVPIARVMFLSFIISATMNVQINRLTKQMEMRTVTLTNSAGVFAGAVVGIGMALAGFGAWAIVGQTLTLAAVRSILLWGITRWRPSLTFSFAILRSYFKVGSGVLISAFFYNIYLNIYAFLIGNRVGLVGLGYYTQADKWSKVGVSSISAVITQAFLPVLSRYQDEPVEYAAVSSKFNRLTAYLTFPILGMLAALAPALFHAVFGSKWDGSIPLFQLLLLQGMFIVPTSLYSNFILARGKPRLLVVSEGIRYAVAFISIIFTLPYIALTLPGDVTAGIRIFLYGQLAASAVFWAIMIVVAARMTYRRWWSLILDIIPYLLETLIAVLAMGFIVDLDISPWAIIPLALAAGGGIYVGLNAILHSRIQHDALAFILNKRVDTSVDR